MQDEESQQASIDALFEWSTFLRTRLDDACVSSTGDMTFEAAVVYAHGKKMLPGRAVVRVARSAFEDGKINLLSSEQFDPNKFHTEYVPAWQIYTFDATDGSFEVSGKSSKYGYDYTVVITLP